MMHRHRLSSTVLALVLTLGVSAAVLAVPATPAAAFGSGPRISSPDFATANIGHPFDFTVTATGGTALALSLSGSLPPTFGFTDNGDGTATISGDPPAGTDLGEYPPVTITAAEGPLAVSQSFIIDVEPSLAIDGPSSYSAADGVAFDVPFTAPNVPSVSFTESGALPSGVALVDSGSGSADLEGTTDAGGSQDGDYPITLTAHNGVDPDVTKTFTLTVEPPTRTTLTSAETISVAVGVPFAFLIRTTGAPTVNLLPTSFFGGQLLPLGVNLIDNGDGTATVSGTMQSAGLSSIYVNTSGQALLTFRIVIDATQPAAPTFTSAASATAIVANSFSFTVTTTGPPTPALTLSGALPPTFTFTDNGDGTATIAGNPAADADVGQDAPVTITATNSVATTTQSFTLSVEPPLAISGPSSFTAADGDAFDVPFTAPNVPTVSWTESGTLPDGVTLVDNGSGTADLEGTPDADGSEDGVYPITITADNGLEPDVTEGFTLTIEPPTPDRFTSVSQDTVLVGTPFTFTVTTTGAPTVHIEPFSFHGPFALPPGVSFVDNGDGTATISGTFQDIGDYTVFLTTSGQSTQPVQGITFDAVQPAAPTFTSSASATAIVSNPFSFTVTTTATPTAALSLSGDLPPTFTFTDNGDGTATIAGNPPADADVGQYDPVTITATNSVSTTTQSFTLTVKPPLAITGPTTYTAADGVHFDVEPYAGGFLPFPTLTESGALPDGVTFVDSGYGYADIEGTTSADGSEDGVYPITVTADDGIEPDVTETFTLVVEPPSSVTFTSAPSTAVQVGTPFSFTVTTSGAPTANIEALNIDGLNYHGGPGYLPPFPPGVQFNDNGDGTATISGTVDTPGTYPAVLSAAGDQTSDDTATQPFTLTVLEPAPSCVATACDSAVGTDPDGIRAGGQRWAYRAQRDGERHRRTDRRPVHRGSLSSPAIGATGAYFDVADSSDNAFTSLTLEDCDLLGGSTVEWWNKNANDGAGAWQTISDQTYLPGTPDCVEVDISPTSSPSLSDLTGTVFAIGAITQVPSITSAATTTAIVGQPMTLTVTTAGFPTPALTLTGTPPAGVSSSTTATARGRSRAPRRERPRPTRSRSRPRARRAPPPRASRSWCNRHRPSPARRPPPSPPARPGPSRSRRAALRPRH